MGTVNNEADPIRDAEIASEFENDATAVTVAKMLIAFLKPLNGFLITLCIAWTSFLGYLIAEKQDWIDASDNPGLSFRTMPFEKKREANGDISITVQLPTLINGATFTYADVYVRMHGTNYHMSGRIDDAALLGTTYSHTVGSDLFKQGKYHDFVIIFHLGTTDGPRAVQLIDILGGYRY